MTDEGDAARPAVAWVVLVADPVTGEVDAFGPYPEADARRDATRRRAELGVEGLGDVLVVTVPLRPPPTLGGPA